MRSILCYFTAALSIVAAEVSPVNLRCEYDKDPLAVSSAKPRLSWVLKADASPARGARQTAYRILVASSPEELARDHADLWDSGRVSALQAAYVPYAGKPLAPESVAYWKLRVWDEKGEASPWSEAAKWRMSPAADWGAKWIAARLDTDNHTDQMPIFRRGFRLAKPVRTAVLYISGLGQYEAYINGAPVSQDVLLPGWTDYRKTILYNTFDVTSMLRPGTNAIGVLLGNGMFHAFRPFGRFSKFVGSFGQPKLIARLRVTFVDGAETDIVTDKAWRMRPGPIVFSSPFGGEDFDARLEPDGWTAPGIPEDGWTAALEVPGPGGTLRPETSPAIRVHQSFRPARVTEPKPGVRVYDLGQNFSGWPQVTVRGAAGAQVKITPGELLAKDGLVTQDSQGGTARRGRVWLTYTLKGSGKEVWRPRFFYYGYRYVQVEGPATVEGLEGQFVYSSSPEAGEFACSKPLFNRIHSLILAAMRSNLRSVLTDCPHREKLGWLEQTHLAGSALMYNFDLRRLYEKIERDMADEQTATGLVPNIAPEYVVFENGFRDSPEWGSAVVLNPWIYYQHYADASLMPSYYDVMARYARYLGSTAKEGIVSHGLGDWYDVGPGGLGTSKLTSLGLTATASYYTDLRTLAKAALLAGRPQDAPVWNDQAETVAASFQRTFYHPETGAYDRASQTAGAMPLATGLVPGGEKQKALAKLVETIRNNGNRVTAGDVGFHYVVQALLENGRNDVLYDMLSRTDGPSYGYQLERGATSLTEAWDADPSKSQNHFMLGHAEEWFYRGLAGLDIDFSRRAGEQIRIAPGVVGDVTQARAKHDSIYGPIAVEWKLIGELIRVEVELPPGASAIVEVPTSNPDRVSESGKPAAESAGVVSAGTTQAGVVFRVQSGRYVFEAPRPR
jgi:hypothetical protein